jgi:hypothetical protein
MFFCDLQALQAAAHGRILLVVISWLRFPLKNKFAFCAIDIYLLLPIW